MKAPIAVPVFFLANVFCVACRSSAEYSESSASTSDYAGSNRNDMNYASNRRRRLQYLQGSQGSGNNPSKSHSSSSRPQTGGRRKDQSKDLKRIIQELEESDYGNYGSWGNFREKQQNTQGSKKEVQQQQQQQQQQQDASRLHFIEDHLQSDYEDAPDAGLPLESPFFDAPDGQLWYRDADLRDDLQALAAQQDQVGCCSSCMMCCSAAELLRG
jgi:hypothetical protein